MNWLTKKPTLKNLQADRSSWITNFWYSNQTLFLTDSVFDENQNVLGMLDQTSLADHLGFRKLNDNFLNHPNPNEVSALDASLSAIKAIDYTNDFIYHVFSDDEFIYVGLISQDKVSGKTIVYDHNFNQIKVIKNYLILGKFQNELLFIKVGDRQSYVYHNKRYVLTKIPNLIKALNFKDFDLVLSNDFKVYQVKNQINCLIYEANNEIEIAKLNEEVMIISDKATQTTFSLSLLDLNKKISLIDEYFFHLEVINNTILVGKPLFYQHQFEDYNLPLRFIF